MDLAAGFGFLGCIAGFSLLGCSRLADMMVDCLDVRSDVLMFE